MSPNLNSKGITTCSWGVYWKTLRSKRSQLKFQAPLQYVSICIFVDHHQLSCHILCCWSCMVKAGAYHAKKVKTWIELLSRILALCWHINIPPLDSSSIFLLTNYTNSKTQQMPTLMMIVTTPQSMKILPQTYLMVTKTEDSLIFCWEERYQDTI